MWQGASAGPIVTSRYVSINCQYLLFLRCGGINQDVKNMQFNFKTIFLCPSRIGIRTLKLWLKMGQVASEGPIVPSRYVSINCQDVLLWRSIGGADGAKNEQFNFKTIFLCPSRIGIKT